MESTINKVESPKICEEPVVAVKRASKFEAEKAKPLEEPAPVVVGKFTTVD